MADAESEPCEFAKSNDAEDAFVSQGEHEFCFGGSVGTEGFHCEIGEIKPWVVDSAATRHMTPNPVSMTNYRECDGAVRVPDGVGFPDVRRRGYPHELSV